ncbi:hypothetical protein TNCT_366211 [Trichonephila clavata]|uniref:Uncharacterized protein n=1 Tax=Trichonephila clavata TaxID=2740835 RepID=A0A8X6FIM3_TRICU|nr:hypothetical protein TNCT_366211 [Trichonephila clavata]
MTPGCPTEMVGLFGLPLTDSPCGPGSRNVTPLTQEPDCKAYLCPSSTIPGSPLLLVMHKRAPRKFVRWAIPTEISNISCHHCGSVADNDNAYSSSYANCTHSKGTPFPEVVLSSELTRPPTGKSDTASLTFFLSPLRAMSQIAHAHVQPELVRHCLWLVLQSLDLCSPGSHDRQSCDSGYRNSPLKHSSRWDYPVSRGVDRDSAFAP